jgi:hypothetical protein
MKKLILIGLCLKFPFMVACSPPADEVSEPSASAEDSVMTVGTPSPAPAYEADSNNNATTKLTVENYALAETQGIFTDYVSNLSVFKQMEQT